MNENEMNPKTESSKTAMIVAIVVLALIAIVVFASGDKNDMDENMAIDDTDTVVQEDGVMVGGAMMVPRMDIVANAMNADNVTTLVTAVDAAGLVETLQGPGPFTVFAPTNAAFEALSEGTVDTLLMEENLDDLATILTYHVVPGRYTMADFTDGQVLETVNGATLTINKMDGELMVNGVTVETTDVISSNGVTFVIPEVLMPIEA